MINKSWDSKSSKCLNVYSINRVKQIFDISNYISKSQKYQRFTITPSDCRDDSKEEFSASNSVANFFETDLLIIN